MLVEPVVKSMSAQRLAIDLAAVLGVLVCVFEANTGWKKNI